MRQEMTKEAAEEILELPRRYTKGDVRHAYTDLARRYHPDAARRHHFDRAAAQARMVEVNKANEVLKALFVDDSSRVVERGAWVVSAQSVGTAWPFDAWGRAEDPWDFSDEWRAAEPAGPVPLSVRSALLGPVVVRLLFIGLFSLLWWNTFPLLPQNLGAYVPRGAWTLADVARLVAAMVYPTYLLVYEALSGLVSCLVREVLNGAVSWITRRYVDLRPKSSLYGCALYKLLREQVYALLMVPVLLYVAACATTETGMLKVALWVLVAFLGVDTLAACVRGGFVNSWTSAVADRIEARYLLARARLLKRCGAWQG